MCRCLKGELEHIGIKTSGEVFRNLPTCKLVEDAVKRGEGNLGSNGALVIDTGKYTGRSPKDRFIVRHESINEKVNWGSTNLPIEEEKFDKLYKRMCEYLEAKDLYVFDGFVGAMEEHRLSIRVINELASQCLFASSLFRKPSEEELKEHKAEFTIIAAPGLKVDSKEYGINSEAFILVNFHKKIVLIGGTQYSGEIKKSMFSVMNFLLPEKNVFPMHCSANIGEEGDTAIFFGLSGTGKTTLSADKHRRLIGDDEHGWCDEGVFNFEGGCYAKTISLSREKEREIYDALRFGAILENVVLDENGEPDYNDGSKTENTRGAYPLCHISNIEKSGKSGHPNTIIFLTADAFGVLPPISKLTKESAMYHFMSGYTSKLAGTERGITEPKATFSTCFGEPFMLMSPYVYAKLLGEKINKHNTEVYLVNTGWIAGGYGKGYRMHLPYTRAMVNAALSGELKDVEYIKDERFNLLIPKEVKGVPSELLEPINTWENKEEYHVKARELAEKFIENFKKYTDVPKEVIEAGPKNI